MTTLDKHRFSSALEELLRQATWYELHESFEMTNHGEYMYLTYAWQAYYFDEDIDPQSILVPESAWADFVRTVQGLSNGRLRYTLLSQVISSTVHDKLEYPTPFSEQVLQECIDKVYEVLDWHQERQAVMIVPLYNMRAAGEDAYRTTIPLGNASLYLRGSSILTGEVWGGNSREADVKAIKELSVLSVPVTGDQISQKEQALRAADEALKILRFVTQWLINTVKDPPHYNPARFVSSWRSKSQILIHFFPDAKDRVLYPCYFAHDSMRVSSRSLKYAREFRGLDDINHHFAYIK